MRSTFTGINTASTGLAIAQRQIDVTAHNLSNANVEGYSRQRYVTSAIPAKGWNIQFADPRRGKEGGGVETLSLDHIRDLFLDRQFRSEQTKQSYWQTRSQALYYVEDVFNSIDANSLDGVISAFFNSIQELSKNSTDEAIRTDVVANAKKLIDVFHMYDQQLTNLMEQQNFMMTEKVKHTNNLLEQLSDLNRNIFYFELGGSAANDLRDKRALILDELSSLMDITYTEVEFEPRMFNIYGIELYQLKVYAGGYAGEDYSDMLLCSHMDAYTLKLEEIDDGENEIYDALRDIDVLFDPPFYKIMLSYPEENTRDPFDGENNGIELKPYSEDTGDGIEGYTGGLLQSYIDIRDGRDREKTGIPYFLKELNTMVEIFVGAFNEIHQMGYSMPYSNNSGESDSGSGIDFFDPDGLTARTIKLAEAIFESSFNIAASSEYVTVDREGHLQTGNNEIALALIKGVKERSDLDTIGSLEGFYKNFLGTIASETSGSNGMEASQNVLLHGIQTQRASISTVSEDEEMTSLIRFQHAYSAASRCITTIDEMLDKLINGTGRVGLV